MKLLYIKNGNVSAQLKRLGAKPVSAPEGGPDAFLGDLLVKNDSQKLMVSWDVVDDDVSIGNVRAITYKVGGSKVSPLKKVLLRARASVKGTIQILTFWPDRIICGRVGMMLWLTFLLSRIMRKSYIHSRHNSLESESDSFIGVASFWLDKFCIRHADGVICHGPFLVDQVINIGIDSFRVFDFDVGYKNFSVNPGVDFQSSQGGEKNKVLLYIGRMAANKGIYDLLETAQNLLADGLNVSVIYIGDGPDLQALRNIVNEKKISEFVDVKGRVDHDQLPLYISQAHLMVTPTRSEFPEGRCMSAMEALACGVPLIAPDNGPFPYLVEDDVNGKLYEVDNVPDMTRKLNLF